MSGRPLSQLAVTPKLCIWLNYVKPISCLRGTSRQHTHLLRMGKKPVIIISNFIVNNQYHISLWYCTINMIIGKIYIHLFNDSTSCSHWYLLNNNWIKYQYCLYECEERGIHSHKLVLVHLVAFSGFNPTLF